MAKSIKLKDETYIDSSAVIHNREKLSEILKDSGTCIPALLNNWQSKYFNPCYYRKIGKIVYLYGVVGGSGSAVSDIFELPIGYRPRNMYCSFICRNGSGICRILINSTGIVTYENINGDGSEVSLYGVFFFID